MDGLRDAVRHGQAEWVVRGEERIEAVTKRAYKELADPSPRSLLIAIPGATAGMPVRYRLDGANKTG